ncbi:MAG: hypothetical protein K9K86_11705 [Pseudomonadales bacterium]|nr:hypothetical protein [Pseudomonadales bacterium]
MSITSIYDAALLAQASYADGLTVGSTGGLLESQLVDPNLNQNDVGDANGVSQAQAAYIASSFEVVYQQATTASGFSATLFQETSGEYYLALRGTDGQGPDWTEANLNNALSGISRNQVVDMLNFYLRLTQSGSVNQYKYDEIISTIGAAPPSQPYIVLSQSNNLTTYGVLSVESNVTGLGLINENQQMTVTGYSLGGHLASAFTLIFPSVVNETYTFNSAGFIGWGSNEFDQFARLIGNTVTEIAINSDLLAASTTPVTDITAPEDLVSHLGSHIGLPVEVEVESLGGVTDVIEDHAIDRLSDSLAVMNFMATLDPMMTVTMANSIFLNAFNDMAMSLESLMRGFAGFFGQSEITVADSDHDAIYSTIEAIVSGLNGETFNIGSIPSGSIASLATQNTDEGRGYRYALVNLLPFAITSNLTGTAADDPKYDADNYSSQYLTDRAQMLELLITRNTADITTSDSLDVNLDDALYIDQETNLKLIAGDISLVGVTPTTARLYFGDDSPNGTTLGVESDQGDDRLYGIVPFYA